MADEYKFTNEPVEITVLGKTFKCRQLGPVAVLSFCQQKVRSIRIAELNQVLSELELSEQQQVDLVMKAMNDIPRGDDLTSAAVEYMNSVEGFVACFHKALSESGQEISVDEVFNLVDEASSAEMAVVRGEIMGEETEKGEDEDEENPIQPEQEKNK